MNNLLRVIYGIDFVYEYFVAFTLVVWEWAENTRGKDESWMDRCDCGHRKADTIVGSWIKSE